MAHWIWYPGDFEVYHALRLNCRREEHGYFRPAFWKQDDCWKHVRFRRTAVVEAAVSVRALGNGIGNFTVDGKLYRFGAEVVLPPGAHEIVVDCAKPDGLPCAYVEGGAFDSGEGWQADHFVGNWLACGFDAMYADASDDPQTFKFCYQRIEPVSSRAVEGGTLWDFGRETFAELVFDGVSPGAEMRVFYGESEREALDVDFSYLRDAVPQGDAAKHTMPARAFRYVFVSDAGRRRRYALSANYEYLPLAHRGSFRCSDQRLNDIWDVAAYTFHLNSREFFLDGIKRDRWVWSGDAYQSYLISYYLFFDRDIVKRTMLALRGKEPVEQHLNTIMDYSFYWVIALGDYLHYTGDAGFVRSIWPRLVTLLQFCLDRRDADGFMPGREGDWVFIDWAEIDKTGAVCAEQMLLCRALEVAADCAGILDEDCHGYRQTADALRQAIEDQFWDAEKRAYIDSFASGQRNVTRHANLFAILLGFADQARVKLITESVIGNDAVPQIRTPYFKFYELEALCATGQRSRALDAMRSYWGGMLDLGATTIWEEFDPRMSGDEHYAMYGEKYHKSLCHAWGASPIYLLGRYYLGVRPTSDGYQTFEVAPDAAGLAWMEGNVPIVGGNVSVSIKDGALCVKADRDGGTLIWRGERIPLPAGEAITRRLP